MPVFKKIQKISFLCAVLILIAFPAHSENIARDLGLIQNGVSKGMNGAVALPVRILQGATRSFPFGIITGAIRGTFETVGWVVGGAFDAARGAAPYAKYAALL